MTSQAPGLPPVSHRPPAGAGVAARLVAIAACVAVDAVAAMILLRGAPLPRALEGSAAVVAHGTAVLLLAGLTRGGPSRRWLSVAALAAVPCVGAVVAATTELTRGSARMATRRLRRSRRGPLTAAAVRRLGRALSPCDALRGDDEEERHAAMSALSRRSDTEAIALLRWVAAGRDADLALSAALALDEIGGRTERRAEPDRAAIRGPIPSRPAGARHVGLEVRRDAV